MTDFTMGWYNFYSMSFVDLFFIFGAKYLYFIVLIIAGLGFYRLKREKQKELIILAFISLPIIFLISRISSIFYFNPRPFVVGHFVPLVYHEPDNGFPSDHTLLLSSVAMLFYLYRRRIGYVLFFLTAIVAFSRVYVGVHHTIDVLCSLIIATVVITLLHSILKYFKIYTRVWPK